MALRQADFAGSWYPDTARACRSTFDEFDRRCRAPKVAGPLRGGIVPHAGWAFSGAIAYEVIRALARDAGEREVTVVLFGGHLHPGSAITVMDHGAAWTPLGEIPTDEELAGALCERHQVQRESPERHTPDNTVELQLPMLRHLLPAARVVIVGAPPRPEMLTVAADLAAEAVAMGRQLLLLGSTDLTHYGPNYGWAPKGHGDDALSWVRQENDPRWIELACQLQPQAMIDEALASSNACCPGAAAAAVAAGLQLGAQQGELLSYATSADVRPAPSFVGYAGIVF